MSHVEKQTLNIQAWIYYFRVEVPFVFYILSILWLLNVQLGLLSNRKHFLLESVPLKKCSAVTSAVRVTHVHLLWIYVHSLTYTTYKHKCWESVDISGTLIIIHKWFCLSFIKHDFSLAAFCLNVYRYRHRQVCEVNWYAVMVHISSTYEKCTCQDVLSSNLSMR